MSRIPFELGDGANGPEQREFVTSGRRFHLTELIGRGSFGDVYLADQESEGGFRRKVVLKVLNEDVATMQGASRQMRNEARVLGLLVHRHIVAVLDLVRFEDRWAILMDHVPGADLERVLDALELRPDDMFPVPAALETGAAICDALHAAIYTDNGEGGPLSVVHRDIKPSNVQLTPEGEIKVLDFGVARFSVDGRSDTAKKIWIGTERYMSPERIRCEGDTPAGNVYGTAATVMELLLGRPLGRTPVLGEEHRQFVEDALDLVRTRVDADPFVVDQVLDVLRRALHSDPEERPDAKQLGTALEELAGRVRGESLKQFSRRFVSRIDEMLGKKSVPASGTLREGTTSRSLLTTDDALPAQHGANRTPISNAGATPLPVAYGARTGPRTPIPVARHLTPLPTPLRPTAERPRRTWLHFALHAGGVVAGAVGGIVVGPAIAVAVMFLPSGEVPAVEPTVEDPAPAERLVVEVTPVGEDPFGRTLLGAPLFPGSRPELVGVVINPSNGSTAPIPEAMVTVEDATAVSVTCGSSTVTGGSSVRLTDVQPQQCVVAAEWLGSSYTADVVIDRSGTYRCQVDRRVLTCP